VTGGFPPINPSTAVQVDMLLHWIFWLTYLFILTELVTGLRLNHSTRAQADRKKAKITHTEIRGWKWPGGPSRRQSSWPCWLCSANRLWDDFRYSRVWTEIPSRESFGIGQQFKWNNNLSRAGWKVCKHAVSKPTEVVEPPGRIGPDGKSPEFAEWWVIGATL